MLSIADGESSRFVDVDTADGAAAHTDMIVVVARTLYYGSVPVSLQVHHELGQYLTGTLRILQVC